jgi:hypothetical protein
MVRIVITHYRYKRPPPKKKTKAADVAPAQVVRSAKPKATAKSPDNVSARPPPTIAVSASGKQSKRLSADRLLALAREPKPRLSLRGTCAQAGRWLGHANPDGHHPAACAPMAPNRCRPMKTRGCRFDDPGAAPRPSASRCGRSRPWHRASGHDSHPILRTMPRWARVVGDHSIGAHLP